MEKDKSNDGEKNQNANLGVGDLRLKIISLAIPATVAMLVVSLYSICDTYFLARIGEVSCGGICYPVVAIMQGVVMTFAFGSANNISVSIGKGETNAAKSHFFSGFVGVFLASVLVGGLVGVFASDIAAFCGGGAKTSGAERYLAVQGFSLVIFAVYFFFSAQLRSEGRAGVVMVASLVGLICNFAFDFAVVEIFALGTGGVALATAGAQLVAGVVLAFAVADSKISSFDFAFFGFFEMLSDITLGSSSFFRQLMGGLSAITLNIVCGKIGGEYLAGSTIASKISVMIFSFGLGLGQGMQPVMAYYYGKSNEKSVRSAFVFTFVIACVLGVAMGGLQYVFADKISALFANGNSGGGEIASQILKWTSASVAFSFAIVIVNMSFQACGKKFLNAFVSAARQGLVFVPVLILLSWIFGGNGIVIAHFVSDILAGTLAILLGLQFFKVGKNADVEILK